MLRYCVIDKHDVEVHTTLTTLCMSGDAAAPWLVSRLVCVLDAALLLHWQNNESYYGSNMALRRLREMSANSVEAADRGVLLADPRVAARAPHAIRWETHTRTYLSLSVSSLSHFTQHV